MNCYSFRNIFLNKLLIINIRRKILFPLKNLFKLMNLLYDIKIIYYINYFFKNYNYLKCLKLIR